MLSPPIIIFGSRLIFSNSYSMIGGPISLSLSLLGIQKSTMSLGNISIIFFREFLQISTVYCPPPSIKLFHHLWMLCLLLFFTLSLLLFLKEQRIHFGVFLFLFISCVSSPPKQCSNVTFLMFRFFSSVAPTSALFLLVVPLVL